MKKGNYWPKARARWVMTDYDQTRLNAPVWVWPEEVAVSFIGEVLGLPVPIFVSADDCSQGLWRYRPSDGAIIWRGTWTSGTYDGLWFIEQFTGGDEWVYRRMTFRVNILTVDCNLVLNDSSIQTHGEWGVFLPSVVRFEPILAWDPPWVPTGHAVMEASTYALIRSGGADPDDTAPATWNFTGPV